MAPMDYVQWLRLLNGPIPKLLVSMNHLHIQIYIYIHNILDLKMRSYPF